MSTPHPVTYSVDADGIGWIVFDDPAARVNLFHPVAQAALRSVIGALALIDLKAVVLTSAKERNFCAGADLTWLGKLADARAAVPASRDGQALFGMLAELNVPVVCAIHGACAGGGYELALACEWRIASEAPETVIGLPEVGIGLIPGWGGCARLPRLIGAKAAIEHILQARLVPAAEALKAGLVDELASPAELKSRAKAVALKLAAHSRLVPVVPAAPGPDFYAEQRRRVLQQWGGQPAPLAVLDAVEQGSEMTLSGALELEAALFGDLAAGPVAKAMMQAFFRKQAEPRHLIDARSSPPAAMVAPAR